MLKLNSLNDSITSAILARKSFFLSMKYWTGLHDLNSIITSFETSSFTTAPVMSFRLKTKTHYLVDVHLTSKESFIYLIDEPNLYKAVTSSPDVSIKCSLVMETTRVLSSFLMSSFFNTLKLWRTGHLSCIAFMQWNKQNNFKIRKLFERYR